MKSYTVVMISKDNISPQVELTGVPAYRRCAEKCAKYFETDKIYVPALENPDTLGNISILNRYPDEKEIGHNLVVIDSALIFEGKFLWRMRNRFEPPLAAYSEDLKPLGFAIFRKEQYHEAFFDNPWSNIDTMVDNDLRARVVVIDTHYFRISSKDEVKDAENFILRSLSRQSDGIISANVNRAVSIKITKFLSRWKINPHSLTSISLVLGLTGAFQLFRNSYEAVLTGMIILQLSSILAGVDGETAKLTLRRTEFGKWYNAVANDIVTLSFLGILTLSIKSNSFFYESGIVFMSIYLIYIFSNYIFTLVSSMKKGSFFVQEIADKKLSKNSYEKPLIFLKRDMIIFTALVLSIFGIHEYLPFIYIAFLFSFLVSGLVSFLKNKGASN